MALFHLVFCIYLDYLAIFSKLHDWVNHLYASVYLISIDSCEIRILGDPRNLWFRFEHECRHIGLRGLSLSLDTTKKLERQYPVLRFKIWV